MSSRRSSCEACGGPLSAAGAAATGVCFLCRMRGAAFARAWMADLRANGRTSEAIGRVVGVSAAQVRARLSERRRAA